MRKIYTFLLYLSFLHISLGQVMFQKEYGEGNWDHGNSVWQTADGGYIVAGEGNDSAYVIKTNGIGDTLWTRHYSGNALFSSVQQTDDGGYIMCGSKERLTYGYDIYMVKTDVNGDTTWTKIIANAGHDFGNSVQQTSDGGYIITGCSISSGAYDLCLIKFDTYGNVTWTKIYGGSGNDQGVEVHQTTDGGYIICGLTTHSSTWDVYLIKADANGDSLWTKTFGGVSGDYATSVRQTSDGGYILAGETWNWGAGYSDAYWIKTDATGNIQWTKTYGGTSFDQSRCIRQTADGGYIAVGTTASFGVGPSKYFNVYLIKTNSLGDTAWTRTFGAEKKDIHGAEVQQTADGGYIITGHVFNYGGAGVTVKLIKTDDQGHACFPASLSQKTKICAGDSVVIGQHTYYNSGTYTDTLRHGMACDTIVTTHLIVSPLPDVTLSSNATTITANQSGAVYQWMDCFSGSVMPGATKQNYTPVNNGTYEVIIDLDGCENTSSCIAINSVNITEFSNAHQLLIYPNPSAGSFIIKSSVSGIYHIVNDLGQIIRAVKLDASGNNTALIENVNAGIYFVIAVGNLQIQKLVVIQ